MPDMYSVEVRESLSGGDDYSENHYDFETPEQVRAFIKNDLHEDERIHSILFYRDGTDCNPKDVTRNFRR